MATTTAQLKPAPAAIVLAFPVPGADPLDELAGLPLALRAVLTVQKEGASNIYLIAKDGRRDIGTDAAEDRRVKIRVDVFPSVSPERGLAAVLPKATGPVIIAMSHAVVDPAVYRALSAADLSDKLAVIAVRGGTRIGPLLAAPDLAAALAAPDKANKTLDEALTLLLAEGRASNLEAGSWSAWVDTLVGRERAFQELFEACRKPVDGIVARHLNRHISIAISKRIVGLPVTPNMLSVFTFLLGVLGAWCCAQGGYWPVLAGAFFFQWNSILDGVDGELARVRFQHSKLGQWLDTVSDDASNLIFYAGLGAGARSLPIGGVLNVAAWVGIVASAIATAIYYTEMARKGTGDLYAIDWDFDKKPPEGLAGKLLIFWRYVLKKDFAILFFLVLAVFGVLPYALFIVAGGAIGTLIAAIHRAVTKRRIAAAREETRASSVS